MAAWISILCQARQSPFRLSALAGRARAVDLEDENLQEICSILVSSPSRFSSILAVASGVVCAMFVTAVVLPILQAPSIAANPSPEPAALVSAATTAHVSVATMAAADSSLQIYAKNDVLASVQADPPAVVQPEAVPTPAPAPTPTPTAAAAPAAEQDYTGRCRGSAGELIGYWYAGSSSPGSSGETITAPVTTNVRADYPDVHNDFDARATVRCILLEGQQVTLSVEPQAVPGGRYWVPLYGGDLN
jgi:hypothetical protein